MAAPVTRTQLRRSQRLHALAALRLDARPLAPPPAPPRLLPGTTCDALEARLVGPRSACLAVDGCPAPVSAVDPGPALPTAGLRGVRRAPCAASGPLPPAIHVRLALPTSRAIAPVPSGSADGSYCQCCELWTPGPWYPSISANSRPQGLPSTVVSPTPGFADFDFDYCVCDPAAIVFFWLSR